MVATGSRERAIDGLEGLIALVGITVGAIPLVRWIVSEDHGGLFRWLFGEHTGAAGYVVPVVVLAVTVGVIAVLEAVKRRG